MTGSTQDAPSILTQAPFPARASLTEMRPVARVTVWVFIGMQLVGAAMAVAGIHVLIGGSIPQPDGAWIALPGFTTDPAGDLAGSAVAGYLLIGLTMAGAWATVVAVLVLLAKAWGSIDDGGAALSMTRAVLLTLIPFFNVIGVFFSYGRLPKACDEFFRRHGVIGAGPTPVIFWGYAVCHLLEWLPLKVIHVGIGDAVHGAAGVMLFGLNVVITVQLCRAINAIAEAQQSAAQATAGGE